MPKIRGKQLELSDNQFEVSGSADATKKVAFDVDTNVPTSTTVTLTAPASSGTIALTSDITSTAIWNSDAAKTASFTATANGGAYRIAMASAASSITMTLPVSPTHADIVDFVIVTGSVTFTLLVDGNGKSIRCGGYGGLLNAMAVAPIAGTSVRLVYDSSSDDWFSTYTAGPAQSIVNVTGTASLGYGATHTINTGSNITLTLPSAGTRAGYYNRVRVIAYQDTGDVTFASGGVNFHIPGVGTATSFTRRMKNSEVISFIPEASSNTWEVHFESKITYQDDELTIVDNSDRTKELNLQLSGITTATTRTLTIPDASGTVNVRKWGEATIAGPTSITASIPFDTTIPQSTEGTQILSAATVTPGTTTGSWLITCSVDFTIPAGQTGVLALFVDSETDARKAVAHSNSTGTARTVPMHFHYRVNNASASGQTWKVRAGVTGGTGYIGGTSGGGDLFSTAGTSSLLAEFLTGDPL